MTVLADIHLWLAWVVVAVNALAGVWSLAAHWQEALQTRYLWYFVGLAQILIFVQVVVGVALQQSNDASPDQFHSFYGFVAFATVGLIYNYRQDVGGWRYVLYGLGSLFLMGLLLRATQFA